MKTKIMKGLFVFAVFGAFFITGCSSLTPVPYAIEKNEAYSASITFARGNPSVSFVYYNNNVLPEPEEKTYWSPIMFPSGVPMQIMVHAYYQQDMTAVNNAGLSGAAGSTAVTPGTTASRSVDIDVLFMCPPLTAGRKYTLTFRKEAGVPGTNRLILTDVGSKTIIHQQEFEMR